MRQLASLVASIAIAASASADMSPKQWQAQTAADSVKSAILYLAANGQNRHDQISGLIVALGLMKTPEADQTLVALSDYYLGESVSEDTTSVVTYRGNVLIPRLHAQLLKDPSCEEHARCLTREQRDERLKEWIGYLERGEKVDFNQ
jgi:hypothetical protein